MIVTKIQLAAMSRADIPEEKRRSFYLYVDEIHNFLTQSFCDILSEARKYGLSLVLTHQYIEQLDEEVSCAIFGNVGTLITFRVGARDAEFLKNEFHPVFDQTDLTNLPNYHIYLKLMIDGVTSKPFSAITLPPQEIKLLIKKKIIKTSRKRFARNRKEVEQEIMARTASRRKTEFSPIEIFLILKSLMTSKLLTDSEEEVILDTPPHILFLILPIFAVVVLWFHLFILWSVRSIILLLGGRCLLVSG